MLVRILKKWIAADGFNPGDVVEVEDCFIEHGLATGLCELVETEKPAEDDSVEMNMMPARTGKRGRSKP